LSLAAPQLRLAELSEPLAESVPGALGGWVSVGVIGVVMSAAISLALKARL
jgi:hypothetical protein